MGELGPSFLAVQACLDDGTLDRFVAGRLTVEDAALAKAHIDACGECRELFACVARSDHRDQDPAGQDLETLDATPKTLELPPRASRAPGSRWPQVGDVVGEKYVIERQIGSGGMGRVYAARHEKLGHQVAIKVLMLSDADGRKRFEREARAMVQLRSPHAARVFDVGTLGGNTPYLVMELLTGMDLGEHLDRRKVLSVEEAFGYALEACDALAEAHDLGIIHRDLKPRNLFLARERARTRLCVIDFGLAKTAARTTDEQLTQSNVTMGTPHYMAPEQLRDPRSVDGRADVWGLGVCLYRMLSGHLPFDGPHGAAVALRLLQDEPRPLAELRPDLPIAVTQLVHRCLSKEPAQRFASASALADALRLAVPSGSHPQRELDARASRRPLLVACAVATLALLAVLAVLHRVRRTPAARVDGAASATLATVFTPPPLAPVVTVPVPTGVAAKEARAVEAPADLPAAPAFVPAPASAPISTSPSPRFAVEARRVPPPATGAASRPPQPSSSASLYDKF